MQITDRELEFIEYYELRRIDDHTFRDSRGFYLKKHNAYNGRPGWNYALRKDDDGAEGTPYLFKDISDAYIKGLQTVIDCKFNI